MARAEFSASVVELLEKPLFASELAKLNISPAAVISPR